MDVMRAPAHVWIGDALDYLSEADHCNVVQSPNNEGYYIGSSPLSHLYPPGNFGTPFNFNAQDVKG